MIGGGRFMSLYSPLVAKQLISYKVFGTLVGVSATIASILTIVPNVLTKFRYFLCHDFVWYGEPEITFSAAIPFVGVALIAIAYIPTIIKVIKIVLVLRNCKN